MAEVKLVAAIHWEKNMSPFSFSHEWLKRSVELGLKVHRLNFKDSANAREIASADLALWHWFHVPFDKSIALPIISMLEKETSIAVYPSTSTCCTFDEKIAQNGLFRLQGIRTPETWLFLDRESALRFAESDRKWPLVQKSSQGAGSSGVALVQSKVELLKKIDGVFPPFSLLRPSLCRRIFNRSVRVLRTIRGRSCMADVLRPLPYIYLQEFVSTDGADYRITVIGNRAFGFRRKNRPDDFRASGSGLIEYDPTHIALEAVQTAFAISRKNHFQSMAYDFLKTPDGELLCLEISYGFSGRAVEKCPGYWDPDLNWHDGHVVPEHAILEDLVAEALKRKTHTP